MDPAEHLHARFLTRCAERDFPTGPATATDLAADEIIALFRSQCTSRHLDLTSRRMQKAGQGFYTIGSSGHEGMAAVAHALEPTDMAFLHYRDAAFQIHRAGQVPEQDPIHDILLSFAAAKADPMSGGRHKVLGSRALMIPPQTSTIASHLPKAVGAAYSIGLARRRAPEHEVLRRDGIVVCSFGDASANHSTAQGAFNSAGWTAYQNVPMPLLFVCEDNGIGISVRTPKGWIAESFATRPGLKYFAADGLDLFDTARTARAAARYVRDMRRPAFLHLRTVRLLGHAGSDVEASYRTAVEIAADERNDPLLHTVRLMDAAGVMTPDAAVTLYEEIGTACAAQASVAVTHPPLATAKEVMASIAPPGRICAPSNGPTADARAATFGSDLKAMAEPQPMNRLIGWALTDLMLAHPEIIVAGEDVGAKGGVYGVTQKLQARFGPDRVMDTLLDEQSILGLATGLSHNGFIPVPEIQFLAYLHNAEDQVRGEAATLPFFSNGQFTNPMVIRIAGLGYQRGFGGHFHNDNSLAVLRDIPGLIIACPSNGADAVGMLRECIRLAREEQRICVFLEPIALYPMRDVDPGDGAWLRTYPAPGIRVGLGEVAVSGPADAVAIVSYANGHHISTRAARLLEADGIPVRLIDMRWLAPVPEEALLDATGESRAILIVDECRRTGSQSEALVTLFAERSDRPVSRITADDSFIATGPAYAATLPSVDDVVAAVRAVSQRR
ncbi:MAG: thiamine pyrophosphate-dependent enzyme [Pseudomonadota bacterium]